MSTTFWCPDAPSKMVPLSDEEPAELIEVSELPEVNVSGSGASQLLSAIGLEYAEGGTIEVIAIPAHLAQLEVSMKGAELGAALERATGTIGNNTQRLRRLTSFKALLVAAQQSKFPVAWG